jgi:hypothetical protein
MNMSRVARTILILIRICWVMKKHPLVSTLSAGYECSEQSFCRQEQPIEWTWEWRWPLIERNVILECLIIYN